MHKKVELSSVFECLLRNFIFIWKFYEDQVKEIVACIWLSREFLLEHCHSLLVQTRIPIYVVPCANIENEFRDPLFAFLEWQVLKVGVERAWPEDDWNRLQPGIPSHAIFFTWIETAEQVLYKCNTPEVVQLLQEVF